MRLTFLILILLSLSINLKGQKFEHLAMTPPMGWNSWNRFHCDGIHEDLIKEVATKIANNGMKDAGYQYIVIDDCWQLSRDIDGNIIPDPAKFPSGMKALADYIHGLGLKFGLYTCAGRKTCALRPGSRGYEFQDAIQYAKWGVDFVKIDWCHTTTQDAQESYTLMRDAFFSTGRPMVISMCEWGLSKPWTWAKDVAHLWRTTGDITNNWDVADAKAGKVWGGGVLINLDMQKDLETFSGPDHWNDPDMLEVGNGVLTLEEERSHFSLWCMLAAPLFAGNDVRTLSPSVREILLNKEAIAIDQDSLGQQGYKIIDEEKYEVFYKPLSGGDAAICFFNRSLQTKSVVVDWKELKISSHFKIRDVWKHSVVGSTDVLYKTSVPPHGVVMLRLIKQ